MDSDENVGIAISNGQHSLIVGKIAWGADSDTIELYQPDKSYNLGSPVSVLKTSIDQSTFDTITFYRSSQAVIDEILFGNSYSSVLGSW